MSKTAPSREKTVFDGSPASPPVLPDVPPAAAGKTTGSDGGGAGGAGGADAALDRAKTAVERALGEPGGGPRGGEDAGAGPEKTGLPGGSLAMEGPGLDDELAAKLDELGPELAVDTLNDGLEFVGELWSLKHLGDANEARENAVLFRMSARRAERMQKFFERLARQHPEKARAWFARLLWSDPVFLVTDTIKKFQVTAQEGARRRSTPAPSPAVAMTAAPAGEGKP